MERLHILNAKIPRNYKIRNTTCNSSTMVSMGSKWSLDIGLPSRINNTLNSEQTYFSENLLSFVAESCGLPFPPITSAAHNLSFMARCHQFSPKGCGYPHLVLQVLLHMMVGCLSLQPFWVTVQRIKKKHYGVLV